MDVAVGNTLTNKEVFDTGQRRMQPVAKQGHPYPQFREIDPLMWPLRNPHPSTHHLSPHFIKDLRRPNVQMDRSANRTFVETPKRSNFDYKAGTEKENSANNRHNDYLEFFEILIHSKADILSEIGDLSLN